MQNVDQIRQNIEKIAPEYYQMEWDNSGFQVNLHNDTKGILLCLDVTEDIIDEAKELGFGMIVAHHPLLFRATKTIDSRTYHGKCLQKLIENNISLYSAHTSADCSPKGINVFLADMLGLENQVFLGEETHSRYVKVAVSTPLAEAQVIREAMAQAGAGVLGDYTNCSFSVEGLGSFKPGQGAVPHVGVRGVQEFVEETWVQALVKSDALASVLQAIRVAHPYEEPAIDAFTLEHPMPIEAGLGIYGELGEKRTIQQILDTMKKKLSIDTVRLKGDLQQRITKVALCGGSGGSFLHYAEQKGTELYITGEMSHDIYMESEIALVEAGHFDTEKCFCELMQSGLQKTTSALQYDLDIRISEKMERPFMNY